MSRSSTFILLGVLVALVPFSGLPAALRALLAVILGAFVLGLGVAERTRQVREAQVAHPAPEPVTDPAPHGVSPI